VSRLAAVAPADELPPKPSPLTGVAIALVALLVLAAVLNYLDRQALSIVAPDLKREFHLNDERFGWVNSSFSLVYMVSTILGGIWVDRVGVRKGLLTCVVLWSAAAAGHALATGFWSLCFWRAMLAVGEGPASSSLLKGIRRLMPPHLRDTGTALMGGGTALGALLAPVTIVPMALAMQSWRAAFMVTAAFSLLWLPFWTALSARPGVKLGAEEVRLHDSADEKPQRLEWGSCALWATLVCIFCTVPSTVFTNNFISIYLDKTYHLPLSQIKNLVWQPFLFTDIGQLTGGIVVGVLVRFGWRYLSARRLVIVAGFLGSLLLLKMNGASTPQAAMWWFNFSRLFFTAAYIIVMAHGIETVAEGQTALMNGLMNGTFSACNVIFNPLIGRMADHLGSYQAVIVLVSIVPLFGLVAWLILSAAHSRRHAVRG
jgi:ACS family hexuronate transporter-like MFS transporter